MAIMQEVGFQRGSGTPASAEQIEKAKALAKEKGLDPELVAARLTNPAPRRGGGGRGNRGGGRGGEGGGSAPVDRGFNNTVFTRTLYKIVDPAAKEKKLEAVSVRLGISDGITTEVLDGLSEGDTVVTSVQMPGAAPMLQPPGGAAQNPFQGGGRGGFRGR
jgi:HlyD family secretion protein